MNDQTTSRRVYLDNAATAPLRQEVLEAMLPWMGLEASAAVGGFGNASTLYAEGRHARQALEAARAAIAAVIGAMPFEVVFCSGGTEADNMAMAGICAGVRERHGSAKGGNRVLAAGIEHHAVLEPLRALRRGGWQTGLISPNREGFVTPEALQAALAANSGERVTLVSVAAANNEIGSVQPLCGLADLAHERGALFHSDAVQMLGKQPFDVRTLGLDAASFSAHKLGGPKGIGALYLRSLTPFAAQQLGGGQERGLRSGTQNVAGAVGFARALELGLVEQQAEAQRLTALRDELAAALLALDGRISLTVDPREPEGGRAATDDQAVSGNQAAVGRQVAPGIRVALSSQSASAAQAVSGNQPASARQPTAVGQSAAGRYLPGILSILVAGLESEAMIQRLDDVGFAVSGGSACSTGSLQPSHVLLALGVPRKAAQSVLRISLGHQTKRQDIAAFVGAMAELLA
ncbi:MAG: cysteine desulfurase [Actinomycetia bacterium]|nr:cysteine desulfurase [Actinomycetes bacterium]